MFYERKNIKNAEKRMNFHSFASSILFFVDLLEKNLLISPGIFIKDCEYDFKSRLSKHENHLDDP